MITVKTPEEIEKIKIGGKILATIIQGAKEFALNSYKKGSLTTKDIDEKIKELISFNGVKSSFFNYTPSKDRKPFSGNACISVNDEIVHGVPRERVLVEGDLLSIDLGIIYKDMYTDASVSFVLGEGTDEDKKLMETAKRSLYAGIEKVIIGNTIGDIGNAIQGVIKASGFGIVRNYSGHGVGYAVHEEPNIPNYGELGKGDEIKEGMVFAIEPMIVAGSEQIVLGDDSWAVKTSDGARSAHWEHTVVATKEGPIIVTEV